MAVAGPVRPAAADPQIRLTRSDIYLRACSVGGCSVGHACLQYQNAVEKHHGDVSDPALACAVQNEGRHAIRAGLRAALQLLCGAVVIIGANIRISTHICSIFVYKRVVSLI